MAPTKSTPGKATSSQIKSKSPKAPLIPSVTKTTSTTATSTLPKIPDAKRSKSIEVEVVEKMLTPEEEAKQRKEELRTIDALKMNLPLTKLKAPIARGVNVKFDDYVHRGAHALQAYMSSGFRVLISDGETTSFVAAGADVVPPFRSLTPGTALRTGLVWYDSKGVWHGADEIEGKALGFQKVAHGDGPL